MLNINKCTLDRIKKEIEAIDKIVGTHKAQVKELDKEIEKETDKRKGEGIPPLTRETGDKN